MMEARLILATLLQRCQLLLEPEQEIVPVQLVTVRPKNGIRMRMESRQPMLMNRRLRIPEPKKDLSGLAECEISCWLRRCRRRS